MPQANKQQTMVQRTTQTHEEKNIQSTTTTYHSVMDTKTPNKTHAKTNEEKLEHTPQTVPLHKEHNQQLDTRMEKPPRNTSKNTSAK